MNQNLSGKQFAGTMKNGSYPINNQHEADAAWDLRGRSKSYSEAAVVRHIENRVRKLGLKNPRNS